MIIQLIVTLVLIFLVFRHFNRGIKNTVSSTKKQIVLTGPSLSGKTQLFMDLLYDLDVDTVQSMVINKDYLETP